MGLNIIIDVKPQGKSGPCGSKEKLCLFLLLGIPKTI